MPRLSEGRALSPLMIDPFPSGFAWLTLALPVGAISMKIGSSPLIAPLAPLHFPKPNAG